MTWEPPKTTTICFDVTVGDPKQAHATAAGLANTHFDPGPRDHVAVRLGDGHEASGQWTFTAWAELTPAP